MEFVAELVSALAWPIIALVALVFLRRPLERWMRERPSRINEATQKSIGGLVVLRNLAVHAPQRVSAEEALEFVALAEATQYAITATGDDRHLGTAGE
jgi:hypothetical protein